MITILDENGDIAEATLVEHGRHVCAHVNGRILMPGAFTVLSSSSEAAVSAAELRAKGGV